MQLNFHGHACFSIVADNVNLLIDPANSYLQIPNVNIEELNPDILLISHGHGDHIADAVSVAKRSSCKVISNYEIITWLGEQGVENGMPLNHGGQYALDNVTVKYVNAVHSSVLPDGSNGGNPGGFLVQIDGKNIYYAGDTSLTYDMKLLGEFYRIDLAILPIGDVFTMGVDDAIRASDFVGCDKVVGMHYDTFPPITINKEEAVAKFASKNKELILLNINETLDI